MEKKYARAASVGYWDENARWYKLWIEHNAYHRRIIEIITALVAPGWRIIDIGAGNGVLSLPLAAASCSVTALEPSAGMRALLEREAREKNISSLRIDTRRWEEIPLTELRGYDLIIASNSLHLTEKGFMAALRKVFLAEPSHICIVSEEQFLDREPERSVGDYICCLEERYAVESSYAYHSLQDAIDHWAFKYGRTPDPSEKRAITRCLCFENDHLWKKGEARVCVFWWVRNGTRMSTNISKKEGIYEDHRNAVSVACHDFSRVC